MDDPVAIDDPSRIPLKTLVLQLRDDSFAFVRAQTDVLKAEGKVRGRSLAIWTGVALAALTLALGALVALLFGLMLVLQPHLGMGWSVAVVTLVTLLLAALLGWMAARNIAKVFRR
jgi:Putative Actinobacterial Holin-X, holin superfamily III